MTETKRFAASAIQRQFWLAQQMHPDTAAYNICSAFMITGELSTQVLINSVGQMVQRHGVFRSTYAMEQGELKQCVHHEADLELVQHTCHGDAPVFAAAAQKHIETQARQPFDLSQLPALRLLVIAGPDCQQTAVSIIVHHINIDLRSKDLFAQQLQVLYSALLAGEGEPCSKDNGSDDYQVFGEWYGEFQNSDKADRMLGFWQKQLAGKAHTIPLLADFPRPPSVTLAGAQQPLALTAELSQAILDYSGQHRVDPFVTMLAGYLALLYRSTDCPDFLVAVPLSNRRQAECKDVMGCCVNTLPLGVAIKREWDFDTLVKQVRLAMLAAHRNQEIPIETIVQSLGNSGLDRSRNPLYQVGFTFEHPMQLELPGCHCEPINCDLKAAQLELFMRCWHSDGGLQGQLEYNTDLLSSQSATRMVDRYKTLLSGALASGTTRLDQLGLLSDDEVTQLKRWNNTERSYQLHPLHQAFSQQANKTPQLEAFALDGQRITYGEFEIQSNQLANYLVQQGVASGDPVAVCLERGIEMVLALYAILKAGGAYVPVEPDYPDLRIEHILKEIGGGPVLTTQSHLQRLQKLPLQQLAATVIPVDTSRRDWQQQPRQGPERPVSLSDPAYIIYTSGSTGKPKGVINCHGGIANRLCWMQETFGLTQGEVILAKTPYSFDVSVWEMFWPGQVGATLQIAEPGAHRDPAALATVIQQCKVSTVHFVPAMLETYLAHDWGQGKHQLKRVICSGEELSADLCKKFLKKFPQVELHNLYGPTEAAIDVTHHHCSGEELVVPIGKAIANTQIYIFCRDNQQAPVGVPGEICIGGIQVAKGYHRQPELTEKSFVANPLGQSDTLYRTGDLGRFLEDGSIQFLGRLDFQTKIHGNRVEFGEIEAVLRGHHLVTEAAVVTHKQPGRPQDLVAYLVTEQTCSDEELRHHVARQLPAYMVPAFVIGVSELPRTVSGKVDRKQLQQRPLTRLQASPTGSPASTGLEKQLVRLWARVLQLNAQQDTVGVDDNFFDLGGNSLLLTQIFAELRADHPQLQLASLFQYSTIKRLAQFLQAGDSQKEQRSKQNRQRAARTKNAFAKSRRRR